MKLHVWAALVSICAFSITSWSQEEPCGAALTRSQVQVLNESLQETEHFDIQVYAGSVEGQSRTVVFLGETHYKGEKDAVIGQRIIKQFQYYGLEGVDLSKYWGGKAMSIALDAIGFMFKMFTFGKKNRGSTINDAAARASLSDILAHFKEFSDRNRLAELTPEEADRFEVSINGEVIKGSKILTVIAELEKHLSDAPRMFNLEKDHRPNLVEQVGSVAFPAFLAWVAYTVGYDLVRASSETVSGDTWELPQTIGLMAASVALPLALKKVLGKYDIFSRAAGWTMDIFFGFGRNRTMTNTILKILKEHPQTDTLLVIVGAAHTTPMGRLLIEQGFQRVPLVEVQVKPEASDAPVVPREPIEEQRVAL